MNLKKHPARKRKRRTSTNVPREDGTKKTNRQ